jgi:hypothetical protein
MGKLRIGFTCTVWGFTITTGKADLQQPDHGMGRGQSNDTWHQSAKDMFY